MPITNRTNKHDDFFQTDSHKIDITNCDRELIHLPGQIQPHGFLLVVDSNYIIRFISENIPVFIPEISVNIIGKPIAFFEDIVLNKMQKHFILPLLTEGIAKNSFHLNNPFLLEINGRPFLLIISVSDDNYLLEFETANSDVKADVQKMIGHSIEQMLINKKIDKLLNNSAIQVKNIINYDRVMIYRFAEDGHGEVVAEAKNDDLEPWLGLHYPASDIPNQARELYKINLTRIIANVNAAPSKIITEANNVKPLNLTNSQLRAVSPVHIQYLKNMGVASSFSISLLYKDELWGLIACHNYTPRFIDYTARESSKLIGLILSSALEFMQNEDHKEIQELFNVNLDKLSTYLLKTPCIEDALTKEETTILDVVHSTGAVIVYEKNKVSIGKVPSDIEMDGMLEWIKENVTSPVFFTSNLSKSYPEAKLFSDVASGMLLVVLSRQLEEYIIWFKPEVLKTITWAGNPEKLEEVMPDGVFKLSPRLSFKAWMNTVSATSQNWTSEEIRSANRLREAILYAINIKSSSIRILNEKLKEAYEELDTFSYTISHDLKNPITAIKGYTQLLAQYPAIDDEVKKIIIRIEERTTKMNTMVNDILNYTHLSRSDIKFQKINTEKLISEIIEDFDLDNFTNQLQITKGPLPNLFGDPVMIMQVFANLLSNAVKYSIDSIPPMIHIEGKDLGDRILYSIKDNGIGIDCDEINVMFGLFVRSKNVLSIEGSGVGLAIVKRIVEKHNGSVWAESALGKGTTFFLSFKKDLSVI